jgi:hypothetical protein
MLPRRWRSATACRDGNSESPYDLLRLPRAQGGHAQCSRWPSMSHSRNHWGGATNSVSWSGDIRRQARSAEYPAAHLTRRCAFPIPRSRSARNLPASPMQKAAGMTNIERESVIRHSRPILAQAWKSPTPGKRGKSARRGTWQGKAWRLSGDHLFHRQGFPGVSAERVKQGRSGRSQSGRAQRTPQGTGRAGGGL